MDKTNDPKLTSWVAVAADSHFPIQNLPFGVAARTDGECFIVSAIGDRVIDLSELERRGVFSNTPLTGMNIFQGTSLNPFMALGRDCWKAVRSTLSHLLKAENPTIRDNAELKQSVLIPASEVEMVMPLEIGDYTDFYSSREHATNVGTMFRGVDNALMPNWLHLPVAYHGRASSVVVSGTPIRRPTGQTLPEEAESPQFGASKVLDFELEMGFFIGPSGELGDPISVNDAENHIFGMVLVNDWSARDIQKWEYQPLGPFLAKNFGTTISPWVVTLEALEPFRCDGPEQTPEPLPYLRSTGKRTFDIQLEVALAPDSAEGTTITRGNFNTLYWDMRQQLTHHTVTGCNAQTGDLLASGTISGSNNKSLGSLLELTWMGKKPLKLVGGEERKFIEDGDSITITGWCQGDGYRIGFGVCNGTIIPATKV
ncbi:MAG: fumarylacetoacetase [Candidatus Marinimicrobia bacterium]|nr:fumarylacetoacetase [Candidatus Neomarinimicrobiota bacterium]|tara:strand:+ start:67 stop:1347 length:1281 start_codon:yes stop_codon:yes gene_type:complete